MNFTTSCRSKAWLKYAKRDDLLQKSSSELHAKYFICSSHFTARDFIDPGRTKLMKTAVLTVHPSTYSDTERAKGKDLFNYPYTRSILLV